MNVLTIGGTGLISTAITAELTQRGHDLTLYHRGRKDGPPETVKTIYGDRDDVEALGALVRSSSWDALIDMVCYTPAQAAQLADCCKHRVEHLIFCSTVEVYSKRLGTEPVREHFGRRPSNEYGIGKRDAEDVLMQASGRGWFDLTILRPAYTYGGTRPLISTMGTSTYLDRLRHGRPILVAGDGSCTWTVCHRDDVAGAFRAAVEQKVARGRIYNVTGTDRMTWDEYHQTLAFAAGVQTPDLVHIPVAVLADVAPRTFAPRAFIFSSHYVFDNSRAACDLDFRPRVPWNEGLAQTVASLDAQPSAQPDEPRHAFEDLIISAWRSQMGSLVAGVAPLEPGCAGT